MTTDNDHPAEPFWAVLELMGHVRLAGRISEEERFGSKIGRIDVPADKGCSGTSAGWCPNCGDCTCKNHDDKNDDDCPLHSATSKHGETEGKFVTIYFGGSSVYRMTPCDEDTARAVAARSAPAPIHPYEMPKQLQHQEATPEGDQWHDPEDDEEEDDDDEFSPPF